MGWMMAGTNLVVNIKQRLTRLFFFGYSVRINKGEHDMAGPKIPTPDTGIDKGIPIPPRRRGSNQGEYNFRDMEVGDSILLRGRGFGMCVVWKAATGFTFQSTIRPEDGGKRRRVWRIA